MNDVKMYLKKKKGWVVTASVLTTPLCNLGGLYWAFACGHPHYPNLFQPPLPPPCPSVQCALSSPPSRIAVVFSAPCHPPTPSAPTVFLPSVNICSTEAMPATSGCPAPNDIAHQPRLRSSFLKQQRDCPGDKTNLLFQSCSSILFVACW